jgi:hypothetical protein
MQRSRELEVKLVPKLQKKEIRLFYLFLKKSLIGRKYNLEENMYQTFLRIIRQFMED